MLRVWRARLMANLWCLGHMWRRDFISNPHFVAEDRDHKGTFRISVGTGSIWAGTWKEVAVFYERGK